MHAIEVSRFDSKKELKMMNDDAIKVDILAQAKVRELQLVINEDEDLGKMLVLGKESTSIMCMLGKEDLRRHHYQL